MNPQRVVGIGDNNAGLEANTASVRELMQPRRAQPNQSLNLRTSGAKRGVGCAA